MKKIGGLIGFLLLQFGPILVFYGANHFYGLKAALIASTIWTAGEIAFQVARKKPLSTFFKFSAAVTLVFGSLDVYLRRSVFFRYEAALTNVLVGIYFASTLFGEKPLIQEFAESQGLLANLELTSDRKYYFKFLTVMWSAYEFLMAGFYIWVASNYTLEQGLAIRGVVGNATFYGLLFISIFGAKSIKQVLGKLRLLPSSQGTVQVF